MTNFDPNKPKISKLGFDANKHSKKQDQAGDDAAQQNTAPAADNFTPVSDEKVFAFLDNTAIDIKESVRFQGAMAQFEKKYQKAWDKVAKCIEKENLKLSKKAADDLAHKVLDKYPEFI